MDRRGKVLVLGAGAAGLAAAGVLSAAGRNVLILEARPRIGGRIQTLRDPTHGVPIELGAEFIHGRPAATFDVVREAGLLAYDLPFDHFQRRGRKLVHLNDFFGGVVKVMGGLPRFRGKDVSVAEYVRRHRGGPELARARHQALGFVEGFDAADPERMSAKALAKEMEGVGNLEGETQFRLVDGYGALVDWLARRLDRKLVRIALGAAVTEIRWSRGRVEAACGRGGRAETWRGAAAVITLPLGVLQVPPEAPGSVRFVPDLAAKRHAAEKLASGPIVKAVLSFREAFWEDAAVARAAGAGVGLRDATFLHVPEAPFPVWWTQRPVRVPLLTGWTGGPRAAALGGLSEKALVRAALDSLAALFRQPRRRLEARLAHAWARDWASDPFARGAYSYVTVGGMHAGRVLAEPVDGTLFFAGEATDWHGQASTVAGALASGARAAREVLESGR
jgi:monoamine oxidase